MTKRLLSFTIILLFTSLPVFSQQYDKGTLILKFSGVRNDNGSMSVGINKTEKGWPRKADIELAWPKKNIRDSVFVVKIPDFPYGTYAISVLDDENSNVEMDMTLGIPKEGYGFSNNPPVKLSAPKFEKCSFKFEKSDMEMIIKLNYIGKMK